MNLKSRQKGALIIVGIVLIVVTAILATTLNYLSSATNTAGANHQQSAQALAVAQAGLERASYQLGLGASTGTACATAALNNSNVAVGNGTFTTTSVLYQPTALNTSGISINATTIPLVALATNYAPHGRVRIGTEEINYSGKTTTALTGATRGAAGTTAAIWPSGTPVKQDLCWIKSIGTVGTTKRTVEQTLHDQTAMMVYAKDSVSQTMPFYRLWTGSAWSTPETPSGITTTNNVQFMQIKFSRTRNEAVMGLTDSTTGKTTAYVWDGFAWGNSTTLGSGVTTTTRNFDIAYETKGDRAIVVYNDSLTLAGNPQYKIWNGSSWVASGAVLASYPTTGAPNWIVLASNPLITSNEISMITLDSLYKVHGVIWNGTSWSSPTGAVVWQNVAINPAGNTTTPKGIDVAYEQLSGKALFAWGTTTVGQIQYRTWNGPTATLTAAAAFPTPTAATGSYGAGWVRLAARPSSNEIMFAGVNTGLGLDTRVWNGSIWDAVGLHPSHDAAVQNINNRVFDIVWETTIANLNKAWLMWGDGTNARTRLWTAAGVTGSWFPLPPALGTLEAGTDATDLVQLFSHPSTGNVFSALYQNNQVPGPGPLTNTNLQAIQLISPSGTWSTPVVNLYTRLKNVTQANVQDRAAIAGRKVIPIDWQEIFP